MNNKFPPKKSGEARKQAGKKEEGLGEGIFARARAFNFSSAEARGKAPSEAANSNWWS